MTGQEGSGLVKNEHEVVRYDQDWSGMIRTGQDWSGMILIGPE